MEFLVKFVSEYGFSARIESSHIGVAGVEKIRNELGLNIPLNRINGSIGVVKVNPKINIDLDTAKQSGLFLEKNTVEVNTKERFLNRFCNYFVYTNTDSETAEIKSAMIVYELDREAVINAWREAGFPTEWGFDETEESK